MFTFHFIISEQGIAAECLRNTSHWKKTKRNLWFTLVVVQVHKKKLLSLVRSGLLTGLRSSP